MCRAQNSINRAGIDMEAENRLYAWPTEFVRPSSLDRRASTPQSGAEQVQSLRGSLDIAPSGCGLNCLRVFRYISSSIIADNRGPFATK